MAFNINEVDPGKVIEAQQDEIARLTREKSIVVAQANMAIEHISGLEGKLQQSEHDLDIMRVELNSLKKATSGGKAREAKPSSDVIDGELTDKK